MGRTHRRRSEVSVSVSRYFLQCQYCMAWDRGLWTLDCGPGNLDFGPWTSGAHGPELVEVSCQLPNFDFVVVLEVFGAVFEKGAQPRWWLSGAYMTACEW